MHMTCSQQPELRGTSGNNSSSSSLSLVLRLTLSLWLRHGIYVCEFWALFAHAKSMGSLNGLIHSHGLPCKSILQTKYLLGSQSLERHIQVAVADQFRPLLDTLHFVHIVLRVQAAMSAVFLMDPADQTLHSTEAQMGRACQLVCYSRILAWV